MNSDSLINFLVCQTCMIFLFFESAFGICLGCRFYSMFYKEKAQHCPGEICDVKAKHEIQKTPFLQIAVVIVFFAFVITTATLFNEWFAASPTSLWSIVKSAF